MSDMAHLGLTTIATAVATMSSREIADLCEKRHDNVMRDTRSMLVDLHGEGGLLNFEDTHQNEQNGQTYSIYRLPKRETLILVSGYSIHLRAKIIDRWEALEDQARRPIDPVAVLNDPAAMRGLLLTYAEKQIELQGAIEEMRPQVQALERIALADGSLCVTDAAKTLQVQPKALFSFLMSHGWIYTPHGGRGHIAYQAKLQSGLLEHKTTTVHRSDGSEKVVSQVRVTSKGLARLAREFPPVAKAA